MNKECQDCSAEIPIPEDVEIGEIIECPDCGLILEVTEIKDGEAGFEVLLLVGEDHGE